MTLLRSALLAIALLTCATGVQAASHGSTVMDTKAGMEYMESRKVLASDISTPGQQMTRGEFVRMVTMLVYEHDVDPACFSQLATQSPVRYRLLFREITLQDPLAEFLCAGLKSGIIHGNADGTFRAGDPITVAEASQILYRAYDVGPLNRESLKGQPWYAQPMHDLQVAEVLPGNLYDMPLHHMTFGEAGEIFLRLRIREMSLRQAGDLRVMRGAALNSEYVGSTPAEPVMMPLEDGYEDPIEDAMSDEEYIRNIPVSSHNEEMSDQALLGYITVWARGVEWTIPHPVSQR